MGGETVHLFSHDLFFIVSSLVIFISFILID